jgi:hypothetical protein
VVEKDVFASEFVIRASRRPRLRTLVLRAGPVRLAVMADAATIAEMSPADYLARFR